MSFHFGSKDASDYVYLDSESEKGSEHGGFEDRQQATYEAFLSPGRGGIPTSRSSFGQQLASRLVFAGYYSKFYRLMAILSAGLFMWQLLAEEIGGDSFSVQSTWFSILDIMISVILLFDIILRISAIQGYSDSIYLWLDLSVVFGAFFVTTLIVVSGRDKSTPMRSSLLSYLLYCIQLARIIVLTKHDRDLKRYLKASDTAVVNFKDDIRAVQDIPRGHINSPSLVVQEFGDYERLAVMASTNSPQLRRAVMKRRETERSRPSARATDSSAVEYDDDDDSRGPANQSSQGGLQHSLSAGVAPFRSITA